MGKIIKDKEKILFEVEGPVTPFRIGELEIDPAINNFRPAEAQKKALVNIASDDACYVFAAVSNGTIIGYVAFHQPEESSRWILLPFILELGAIEVAPGWRNHGVAKAMVLAAEKHGFMENYIITSFEYVWHWDLRGTGLDLWSYQRLMIRLFTSHGFEAYRTDDPDVMEHPANIFMARIGKNISEEQRKQFKDILILGYSRF